MTAPFLSSLAERSAKAQGLPAAAGAPPKRFIVMFTHYGCVTNQWFPAKSHGELTAADLMPTTLAPLAPYARKLLMPRGIRSMNEWTANMTRGQGNDSHTQIVGSFFTCQPVTPNSNNPFSFEQATKFNAKPIGPSLDHVMAQQLSPKGVPLLLNTAGQNDSPQAAISYSAAETSFRGLNAPQAFSGLTGLFTQGAPMSPDSYAAIRGKSIVDLVRRSGYARALRHEQRRQTEARSLEGAAQRHRHAGRQGQCSEAQDAVAGSTATTRRSSRTS